jgi:hypothetical protein
MLFDVTGSPNWEAGWSLSQKYILLTRDLLAREKIPFVFTVNPPAFLVGKDEWTEGRRLMRLDLSGVDFERLFTDFEKFSLQSDVPYIDLLNYLRTYPEHPLYYSYDIHPNPKGHKVIADHIFEELVRYGYLGENTR